MKIGTFQPTATIRHDPCSGPLRHIKILPTNDAEFF